VHFVLHFKCLSSLSSWNRNCGICCEPNLVFILVLCRIEFKIRTIELDGKIVAFVVNPF
jgi:hypothetical protein